MHLQDEKIECIQLHLVYRGARNYIQGADIYSAIVDCVSTAAPDTLHGPIKIVMHEMARNQCILVFGRGSATASKPETARAEFFLSHDLHGWIKETEVPVTSRLPYDEGEIINRCRVTDHIIRLTDAPPCSPIEALIAATKLLHQTLHPSDAHKWIIARLELHRLLQEDDAGKLEVELVQNLNNRLTRSIVQVAGAPIGNIFFSAVKP